jgi:lipopolysaccharide transport protein LptA
MRSGHFHFVKSAVRRSAMAGIAIAGGIMVGLMVSFVSTASAQQFSITSDPTAPLDIRAAALDVVEPARRALFSGEVSLEQGTIRLTSKTLYMRWRADQQLHKARAEGEVVLRTALNQVVRGQWAEYDFDRAILEIGDRVHVDLPPTADQDGAQLEGRRFVVDLVKGTGTLTGGEKGRVKGVLRSMPAPK